MEDQEKKTNNSPEKDLVFILGRSVSLCQAELESFLKTIPHEVVFSSPPIFHLKVPRDLSAKDPIDNLAGITKIGHVVFEGKEIKPEELAGIIRSEIKGEKKVNFAVSFPADNNITPLNRSPIEIKRALKENGITGRYLTGEKEGLSSVVIKKQSVLELLIFKEKEKLIVARTDVVQDFENWGKRDYQRPQNDPQKGMLPPKVARMMVNLGVGGLSGKEKENVTLLDPFCGMGTILMEALLVGVKVIGTDQSQKAIENTRQNLEWLKENYSLRNGANYTLAVSEATRLLENIPGTHVDMVVTEPYLGPRLHAGRDTLLKGGERLTYEKIKNIIKGLDKLYLGSFKEWRRIIKPKGKIIIALPSFIFQGKEIRVKNVIDNREKLGYTLVAGPLPYYRPQAVVRRNIYVLEKIENN